MSRSYGKMEVVNSEDRENERLRSYDASIDGSPRPKNLLGRICNAFFRFFSFWNKRRALALYMIFVIVIAYYFISREKTLYPPFEYTGKKPSSDEYYAKIVAHQKAEKPFWEEKFDNSKLSPYAKQFIADEDEDVIPNLCARGVLHNKRHMSLIIRDCDKTRFEIPYEYPYPFANSTGEVDISESEFELEMDKNELFHVKIKRRSTQEVAFDFNLTVYTNHYIEFNITLPTAELYGMGERTYPLQYRPGTFTLFTLDRAGYIDPGEPGYNGQGHQPIYLSREKSGKYQIIYFRNSNFQEFTLDHDHTILWKAIGGIIDFNLFFGDEDPETVVRDYNVYCGGWAMPGFWHLGYQVNKWKGYMNVSQLREIVYGMIEIEAPLDAIWSDVDYFTDQINFLYDEKRFPIDEMRELFNKTGKRWLAIADPYISLRSPVYDFHHNNTDETPFLTLDDSRLCPGMYIGNVVYIMDYVSNVARELWYHLLGNLENKVHFSGLWLDASEISSIGANHIASYKSKYKKYKSLKWKPGNPHERLYDLYMVSPDCLHVNGIEEYDFRPFSSLLQAQMTYEWLKFEHGDALPHILIRANTVGAGKFGYHFLPDVWSNWEALKASMGSFLTYPIFGFAMMGVDVGGFIGIPQTAPELIIRWHQIAVFYPYCRNSHMPTNAYFNNQEPHQYFGETREALKDALYLRYSILKWFYSFFFTKLPTQQEIETYDLRQTGVGTVVRPIFFGFVNNTHMPPYGSEAYEQQFLVGSAVMVTPVIINTTTVLHPFFPSGDYVDLRYHTTFGSENGMYYVVSARLNELVPYFLIYGNFIYFHHFQDANGKRKYISTTEDLDNEFDLEIAFGPDFKSRSQFLNIKSHAVQETYDECILRNCVVNATFQLQNSSANQGLQIDLSFEGVSSASDWELDIYFRKTYLYSHNLDPNSITKVKLEAKSPSQDISANLLSKYKNMQFSKVNDSLCVTFDPPILMTDLANTQLLLLNE